MKAGLYTEVTKIKCEIEKLRRENILTYHARVYFDKAIVELELAQQAIIDAMQPEIKKA